MAIFKSLILGGDPVVTCFNFDESILQSSSLQVKFFKDYSEEWADFVFANREGISTKSYDIVYGPIANDKVGLQIRKLKDGSIDRKEFLHRLQWQSSSHSISQENMTPNDFEYLKEALAADLAEMLALDYGMSVTEALDTLYNSETYAKLSNPETGLYFQSSMYVYSYLKNELSTGKLS